MAGARDSVGNQKHKRRTRGDAAEGRESLKAAALLIGRAISPFTVSPPDDRREKEERKDDGFYRTDESRERKEDIAERVKNRSGIPGRRRERNLRQYGKQKQERGEVLLRGICERELRGNKK